MRASDNMTHTYTPQFAIISSPSRIFLLISPLKNQHDLLKISFENQHNLFSSTLLDIDSNKGFLVLSAFDHAVAGKLLANKNNFHVYTQFNGSELRFTVKLLKFSGTGIHTRYKISFPTVIKYCQRRSAHRVHISLAMNITASFNKGDGQEIVGQLRNISSGGMRIQFLQTKPQDIAVLNEHTACTISFSDKSDIQCTFEIRHTQLLANKKGCSVGGSFWTLEQTQKRTLEHFIAKVERESLR